VGENHPHNYKYVSRVSSIKKMGVDIMPQQYTIIRETGRLESGAIYMEKPPADLSVDIDKDKIEMALPIGYRPMYMYADTASEKSMFYLILRNRVSNSEDILMYIGECPAYRSVDIKLHSRQVLDYKMEDSKKLGGWASVGSIYMKYIKFRDLSGQDCKITREEIDNQSGMWTDMRIGKTVRRGKPDKVSFIRDKTKKILEELF
jgi:hypothetical protein